MRGVNFVLSKKITNMKIVALNPDCSYEVHTVKKKDLLSTLQKLVGGYIEPVHPNKPLYGRHFVYANEEGEIKSMPSNFYASRIMEKMGYNLMNFEFCTPRGVMVLCGLDKDDNEAGLSAETLKQVELLHDLVLKEDEEQEEVVIPDEEENPISDQEEAPSERDASPVRKTAA